MFSKLFLPVQLLIGLTTGYTPIYETNIDDANCVVKMAAFDIGCSTKLGGPLQLNATSEVNMVNCCATVAYADCIREAFSSDAECKDKLGPEMLKMEAAFEEHGCGQFSCNSAPIGSTARTAIAVALLAVLLANI